MRGAGGRPDDAAAATRAPRRRPGRTRDRGVVPGVWSSPAARRRVRRRSPIRVRTCRRSSSFMLNVRGPAIPALCRKSGHLYFGGTGHLHFGPTGQGLIGRVTSTLTPNEGYALTGDALARLAQRTVETAGPCMILSSCALLRGAHPRR